MSSLGSKVPLRRPASTPGAAPAGGDDAGAAGGAGEQRPPAGAALELLVVELAGRHYGAPLAFVREVFNLGPLTPVPTAPAAVAGVANLRGQVIPVLDLMRLLDLGLHRLRLGDPVVLVEAAGTRAGLLVDRVVGLMGPGGAPAAPADRPEVLDGLALIEALRAAVTPPARRDHEPPPTGARP
jgi:hypothetical protein